MRILQVLPALEAGGVERGTVEMTQAIVANGGSALVASAGGRLVSQVERAGGRHVTLSLMTKDPLSIYLNARRLERLIRSERIDLVHARSRAPGWSAYLAARRASVPLVTTWHGVYGEDFPLKRHYNSVMARGRLVIAISRGIAARIERDYGVPPSRIRTIPRGVDPDLFDPAQVVGERVHRLAQAWRVPTGARVVVLPARLTRWKGAEILLDALATLSGGEIFCLLVGETEGASTYARALEQRAASLGMAARLRITGHCNDMPAALALADVVVSASLRPEPFGRGVIEAQAMARPVVAFDHGGAAETIEDGATGRLVSPGDAAALAESILWALSLAQDEREALGARARAAVLAAYTTQRMQAATLAVYREVLDGVGRR